MHLATIFDGKSAWDTVEYEVSTFAKTPKPCILRIKMIFFIRAYRPNAGKSLIVIKNIISRSKKRVFEEAKLDFWAP